MDKLYTLEIISGELDNYPALNRTLSEILGIKKEILEKNVIELHKKGTTCINKGSMKVIDEMKNTLEDNPQIKRLGFKLNVLEVKF